MDHTFGIVSKQSVPNPKSSRLSLLSSTSFIVLHHTFRSVVHFKLTLVNSVSSVSRFMCCPVVPVPFAEETIFPPLYYFCSFAKINLTIFMWVYFWAFCSVPLICLSILLPIQYCLHYFSFTVSFEVR